MKQVALFGGTFDPIHVGHLQSAVELKARLAIDEFYLVPCHLPPHRCSTATAKQRGEMLALALQEDDFSGLLFDNSELSKITASYTIETLQYWRQQAGEQTSLSWVMGSDAFAQLTTWKQWRELTDYAHIIVMQRADQLCELSALEPSLMQWLTLKQTDDASDLQSQAAGKVLFQTLEPWPVSATQVRDLLQSDASNDVNEKTEISTVKKLLPTSVWQYINQQQLYR